MTEKEKRLLRENEEILMNRKKFRYELLALALETLTRGNTEGINEEKVIAAAEKFTAFVSPAPVAKPEMTVTHRAEETPSTVS